MRLAWTAPVDAARSLIVWSTRPVVGESSSDEAVTNWWAAEQVAPATTPIPSTRQSCEIEVGATSPVFTAVFSFDAAANMSAISNVAQVRAPGSSTPRRRLHSGRL